MRISHLHVSNWRNFKEVDVDLQGRLFVVGPNAAGKSNLLDLFRFMGEVAAPGGGLAKAVTDRGGIGKVRSLFARNHAHGRVVLEFTFDDDGTAWQYRLAIGSQERGRHLPVVQEERVTRGGEVILQRPDANDRDDPQLLTQTHLEQISANRQFRSIADHFARVAYFNPVPQLMRSGGITATGGAAFGSDLISEINAVTPQTRKAWLTRIQKALAVAVPEFETLAVSVDAAGRPHLEAGFRNWRKTTTTQTEREFSDGTLRLIGLLWSVVSLPSGGGLLLLEEPELSLNTMIVRQLPAIIGMAQRDRGAQVFLSTHAPELLDDEGVSPDEVIVLQVTSDGTAARLLSEIPEVAGDLAAELPTSDTVNSLIAPTSVDLMSDLVTVGRRG